MHKKGEEVGGGAQSDGYSWQVVYVDHVGVNGVGDGIFNWQVIVRHQGQEVSVAWMSGEGKDAEERAIRYAKMMFHSYANGLLD